MGFLLAACFFGLYLLTGWLVMKVMTGICLGITILAIILDAFSEP